VLPPSTPTLAEFGPLRPIFGSKPVVCWSKSIRFQPRKSVFVSYIYTEWSLGIAMGFKVFSLYDGRNQLMMINSGMLICNAQKHLNCSSSWASGRFLPGVGNEGKISKGRKSPAESSDRAPVGVWVSRSWQYFIKIMHKFFLYRDFSLQHFRIYPTSTVASNSPDLNPVDNNLWEILQERACKTGITDLELSKTPLTNGCQNDDMIQLGPLRSQSLFQFIQISDACFVHLLLQ